MAPLIEQHLPAIVELCKRFGIRRLDLFGSAARGIDFDPKQSDADFFFDFDELAPGRLLHRYLGMAEALESLLGCAVDLVDLYAQNPNPIFRRSADESRTTLYDAALQQTSV